ncbi:MAG TPA: AMP-binding protein, partial [Gemmatimonadaceae bacterium]|nr:AMP-binding protein [Gemmatimonadaceae bacterium]
MESSGESSVKTTIVNRLLDRAATSSDTIAMRSYGIASSGADVTMTWQQWRDESLNFAAALLSSNAATCSSVAILAGNTFTWPVADLGTLLTAKASVGLYPTSAPIQIEQILRDSAAGLAIVDSRQHLTAILEMRTRLPDLKVVVSACAGDTLPGVISWERWIARGAAELSADPDFRRIIEVRARSINPDTPAIIIYTSGSTGEPKGAVISHRCIDASAGSIIDALGLTDSDSTLSFLPFSHAAERIFGLYTRIRCGMEVTLVHDHRLLWEAAQACRPTLFGGLPRYYEKMYEKLTSSEQRESPNAALDMLGGRVRLATSGGASLPIGVAEYLHDRGVTVLGAYGLTEHLCVAINRADDFTFDSVGIPMSGSEIQIADDGEVLIRRSELTFSGYHNLPSETRAAFTSDGQWVLTGDVGELGSDGKLRIIGRKKELLALSNGKKVAPLPIEARLAAHPWIAHAVL